ncbi:molybdate ABC transporter substrate-binding protein [Kaarinaea lacus]
MQKIRQNKTISVLQLVGRLITCKFATTIALLCFFATTRADEIRIAVAANFTNTMEIIVARFEQQTGHHVILSSGSTGKHYAQIVNGAPFDAFFAADVERPRLLEKEGLIIPGSRFTYSVGRLVLWSPKENYIDANGAVLANDDYQHLAIANPKLAPYGRAAQQVLEKKGLWKQLKTRLVRGENIGQTFQFTASGNAQIGFVALSQVMRWSEKSAGSYWLIDQSLYDKIEQQAVMLKETPATRALVQYLQSNEARAIIRQSGYDTP